MSDSAELDSRLIEALGIYYESSEPDRAALMAAYPDLAGALAEHFAEQDRLSAMAAPLRPVSIGEAPTSAMTDHGDRMMPSMGDVVRYFGDYELIREIARGGMGVVFEARQISLNRPVALKMILTGILASDDDRRRFRMEAEAVANLDHPNIVSIHEVGEHAGFSYFSMKLVAGGGMSSRLGEFANHPRDAARVVATIARAVHHAHQRGILHRDLKPSNVLFDETGRPYVTDFGLAKRVDTCAEMTASGAILGTPAYMAPEQAAGKGVQVTTATDVYGLGAILYALIAGKAPFGGNSVIDTLEQVKLRIPDPPITINPRVDRDLQTICLRCLEKDPSRRYSSAETLADDLDHYLAGEPITARRVGQVERAWLWAKRNPVISFALTASAVLLISLVAVLTVSNAILTHKQAEVVRQRDFAHRQEKRARQIVDEMYSRLSVRWLAQDPSDEALRREFLQKAAAYYEEAARALLTDRDTRFEAAHAWLRVGSIGFTVRSTKGAEAAFNRAIELFAQLAGDSNDDTLEAHDGQIFALIRLGDHLFVAGRNTEADSLYKRAIDLSKDLVAKHPGHLVGWLNLSEALGSRGDLLDDDAMLGEAEAVERRIIKDVAELRTDVEPLIDQILKYRIVANLYDQSSVGRAVELGNDAREVILGQVYRGLAFTLEHRGRYSEAAEYLRRSLAIPNQDRFARAHLLEALAAELYLDGKFRESFQASRESLELVPNAPKTLRGLTVRLLDCPDPKLRDLGEALRLAKRGVALAPQDHDIWAALHLAHYRAGNWREAAEAIKKAMEFPANFAHDRLLLAMTQWQMGDRTSARTEYRKAIDWIAEHNSQDLGLSKLRAEVESMLRSGDLDTKIPQGVGAFAH